jgi:hypothetical protein
MAQPLHNYFRLSKKDVNEQRQRDQDEILAYQNPVLPHGNHSSGALLNKRTGGD